MKHKRSGSFLKQSPRVRFRLNRKAIALSLLAIFGGGGLFLYLNTGNVQTSKAAEAEVIVVTEPLAENGLEVKNAQRITAVERYASELSKKDNSVFVRSLK